MNNFKMLNIQAFDETPIRPEPFPYMVIPNLIQQEYIAEIQKDYPSIPKAGSFPLASVQSGLQFNALMDEIKSDEFKHIIGKRFNMDLTDKPVMVTVRGKADKNDGKIHTDSKSKLITLLLYMNDEWETEDGRLRLLYDDKNLDKYATEIIPSVGKALIFKVTENGWHGHKPIIGDRRVIQLNYVTDEKALAKHNKRHRFSAKVKTLASRLGLGGYQ